MTDIHPTAIIEPGARLGRNVRVGAYSIVGPNVALGDDCVLHHHVSVQGHTTLGARCEVFPQAVLGMPPQDIKFRGEHTTLEIGDRNIFREMVTCHPGTGNGGGVTHIGDNNLLLVGVHVAHDCHIGSHCILANYVQFAGHVRVEDRANMGGHCAVHHFVTIGKHAFVGGMTRVGCDVPPFMIVVSSRGMRPEVRMVNGVGLQRSGYSQEDITALKTAFTRLYSRRARQEGTPIRERVQEMLGTRPINTHVEYLCAFLMRSFAHGRNGRYLESLRQDPVHRDSWVFDDPHDLTVHVVGSGSVRRRRDTVPENGHAVFELTATAEAGWRFSGWNGNLSGGANPARIVVDEDKSVTATFTQAAG